MREHKVQPQGIMPAQQPWHEAAAIQHHGVTLLAYEGCVERGGEDNTTSDSCDGLVRHNHMWVDRVHHYADGVKATCVGKGGKETMKL